MAKLTKKKPIKAVKTQPTPVPKKVDLRRLRGDALIRVRRKKMEQFLEFYGKYGTLALACHEIGIREERIHDWRDRDPVFAKQMEHAEKLVGDRLVKEVIHRATVGEPKGIYNKKGELVDTIFEKSDSLTMFATKRFRPEFRDRVDIPLIPVGTTNIQNNLVLQIDPSKLPLDQLEAYEKLLSSVPTPVHGSPAPAEAPRDPQRDPKP